VTSVAGRACVVTGGSSGVGRALAIALARAGAEVWALGRDESRLGSALPKDARSIVPVIVDLEDEDEIEAAARAILAQRERVDVLVHSAGAIALGSADKLGAADFDRQYRVNLRAPFVLTQALLPALKRGRGHVLFVNSSAGLRASSENALYAATKHGLKAYADGLRDAVNGDGIRVTTIYLGRTATPMQAFVHEYEGRSFEPDQLMQPEDVVQVILASLQLRETAEVTDVSVRSMRKLPAP
jgi:NADP-dependent 3-hydroxy acid dehydrogenase YdfG